MRGLIPLEFVAIEPALDLIEVERKRKRHVSHHRYVAIIVDETVAALADFPAETSFAK